MTPARDVVIVGASLAGLRAAEALREFGYDGALTLIGDEAHAPYDRPPLSKQVLSGWVGAHETALPRLRRLDARWRLGAGAVALDRARRIVCLAGGEEVSYDRLIIATGARARRWPDADHAALRGVYVVRTREDAAALRADLARGPKRVLVIGAGFTGSEIASACRELGIAVTVAEAGPAPLLAALGDLVAGHAANLQRAAGVDLRCNTAVAALRDDGRGNVAGAVFSDGTRLDADVVVVCLGAARNVEWLAGAGLETGPLGVVCDVHCRALGADGAPIDDIFACGDVARFPHPLFDNRILSLEHWGTAIDQARVAAANIVAPNSADMAGAIPRFWSTQFGANFKSVGLPAYGSEIVIAQGAIETGRFIAAYGRAGRIVGAVSVNQAQWLPFYETEIAQRGAFPPPYVLVDQPAAQTPRPARFAAP